MKIFSLNVNSFDKNGNRYDLMRDNIEKRKKIALSLAKFIVDEEYDIAFLQEVDYKDNIEIFIYYFARRGYQVKLPTGLENSKIDFCNMIVAKEMVNINYIINNSKFPSARWQEIKISNEIYMLNIHAKDEKRFMEPLSNYLYQKNNHASIIMGDFNLAGNQDRKNSLKSEKDAIVSNDLFLKKFKDCGYIDIKDVDKPYTYYLSKVRGRRLDHCFASKSVANQFECVGHTCDDINVSLNSTKGLTDHCGIVLDISL